MFTTATMYSPEEVRGLLPPPRITVQLKQRELRNVILALAVAATRQWDRMILTDPEVIDPRAREKLLDALQEQYYNGLMANEGQFGVSSNPWGGAEFKAYVAACTQAGLSPNLSDRDGGDSWLGDAWMGYKAYVPGWGRGDWTVWTSPSGPDARGCEVANILPLVKDVAVVAAINQLPEISMEHGKPRELPRHGDGSINLWRLLIDKRSVSFTQKLELRKQVNPAMMTWRRFTELVDGVNIGVGVWADDIGFEFETWSR